MYGFRAVLLIVLAPVIAGTPSAADDLRVQFVTASQQPHKLELQLSGTIEAVDSLDVGFREGGRVSEVLVEEGDHVSDGQALARLDPVQQDQALKVAEASLAAARAAQEQALQASDRAAAMLARGVGTRAARDAALQALSAANGSVERANSGVERARRAVDDTVLRATGASVVTARNIAPGQIVGAAQPAISLAVLGELEALFRAPDDPRLPDVMGKNIHMTTLDFNRPEMIGEVTEIAPLVDPHTGTVNLRARIGEVADGTALLGAAVRGTLEIAADRGIALPWTALMRDEAHASVWVVDDENRVSLAPVEISHFTDGVVFLASGVAEGQIVVGAGSQLLYPGRRVLPAGVAP